MDDDIDWVLVVYWAIAFSFTMAGLFTGLPFRVEQNLLLSAVDLGVAALWIMVAEFRIWRLDP